MLPPPDEEPPDTVPPERARDSSAPPADLGPTCLALRLLALESKVDEIHAETFGISKAFHDIRNSVVAINDAIERLSLSVTVVVQDAQGQRLDRARLLDDVDRLKGLIERKHQ